MDRCDNTSKYIFSTIIKNNRLKMYEYYLRCALDNHYEILPIVEFYNKKNDSGKHLVLRHDVDHISPATRKMFEVEKSIGVKSTYYFRDSTLDTELIKEMESLDFEVGFHFETIANYVKKNKISNLGESDLTECRKILKQEIHNNKKKYNLRSVCSHGAHENVILKVSNNVLLENENYEDYGIVLEAYDREMYEHVDVHIMDDNIRHGCGFAYRENPIEAINNNKKNIVFLAHPNHWYEKPNEKVKNIVAFLAGKYNLESNRKFKRISYNDDKQGSD